MLSDSMRNKVVVSKDCNQSCFLNDLFVKNLDLAFKGNNRVYSLVAALNAQQNIITWF